MDSSKRYPLILHTTAPRNVVARHVLLSIIAAGLISSPLTLAQQVPAMPASVFGYQNFFTEQSKFDQDFLAVPDAKLAGEELKTLTAAPHVAGSKEDYDTAVYVRKKFEE